MSSASRIEYSEKYADENNEYRYVANVMRVPRNDYSSSLVTHRPLTDFVFLFPLSFKNPRTQARHSPQGTGQDASQVALVDRVGMAQHWGPAKPWLATLRHSPVSVGEYICEEWMALL